MDKNNQQNQPPAVEQEVTTSPTVENKSFASNVNPRENLKGFLILFIAFILVLSGISYIGFTAAQKKTVSEEKKVEKVPFKAVSNNSLVFGVWTSDKSLIHAADLNSGKIYEVASLPTSVKQVTVLSKDKVLFINKTVEGRDQGKEIAAYDSKTQQITSLVAASDNFLIDQYAISPNGRYLATWETFIPQGDVKLVKGVSRVYGVDLQNPGTKNLIYTENASGPVHYPLGITDDGRVFMDRFQANTTAGWGRGMSVSNITGSQKQDIPAMAAGTYSTQPVMSNDGKYLVFATYNGVLGPGYDKVQARNDFTQASLNPNGVGYLDTATLEKTTITSLSDQNRYPNVTWDPVGSKIMYNVISNKPDQTGIFTIAIG